MQKRAGFTLLEVLVVVVIAISVTAFAVPAYRNAQAKNQYLALQGAVIALGNAVLVFRGNLAVECPAAEKITPYMTKDIPVSISLAQDSAGWDGCLTASPDVNTGYPGQDYVLSNKKLIQKMKDEGVFPASKYNSVASSLFICPENEKKSAQTIHKDKCLDADDVACGVMNYTTDIKQVCMRKNGSIVTYNKS